MAKEHAVTISVTLWSVARVRIDQRLETNWATTRATNGESTQIEKRTCRTQEGLRRPTLSIKPTEPAAPTTTATRAIPRKTPRNLPSGFPGLVLEVIPLET